MIITDRKPAMKNFHDQTLVLDGKIALNSEDQWFNSLRRFLFNKHKDSDQKPVKICLSGTWDKIDAERLENFDIEASDESPEKLVRVSKLNDRYLFHHNT